VCIYRKLQKIHVKISLSEDSVKGIYSDTTVARTIIEDSSTVQLSRQQYKKIIEDATSLSSRRQKTSTRSKPDDKHEDTPEGSSESLKGEARRPHSSSGDHR
jgi:hypothetical protein